MTTLALGTAQFGLDYGVTNSTGIISPDIAKEMLLLAQRNQFTYIDTAQSYGNAEEVLGYTLPRPNPFSVISKLPAQNPNIPFDHSCQDQWQHLLDSTLKKLKIVQLDSLLLHSPADLLRPDGKFLLNWLLSVQKSGLVRRIGLSIYEGSDLDDLPLSDFQIIQMPCSLYDQRLILDGTVHRIASHSISIHARSLYLQGLLVTPPYLWPSFISSEFKKHHEKLYEWAQLNGFSLTQLALQWARSQSWLDSAVVGVANLKELQQLCTSWSLQNPWQCFEPQNWSWPISSHLDPRQWSKM